MLMPGRQYTESDYQFGYQGSLKDDEITGVKQAHISTYFRECDIRLARWWSCDPSAHAYEGTYTDMGNNPIIYSDPGGDDITGVDHKSAVRTKDQIHKDFQAHFRLKNLFQLQGNTFRHIDKKDFDKALQQVKNPYLRALAIGYYKAVNDNVVTYYINAIKRNENVNTNFVGSTKALKDKFKGTTGKSIDDFLGFGSTQNIEGTNNYFSVVILNPTKIDGSGDYRPIWSGVHPKQDDKFHFWYGGTFGQALAHEVLGHALGAGEGFSPTLYNHIFAIQAENVYLLSKGLTFYRDGSSHGMFAGWRKPLNFKTASQIPIYLQDY